MNIIVFSYNRAMQLELFLSSLKQYFKMNTFEVNIIYNSSDGDYEIAYQRVRELFKDFNFIREKNIKGRHFKHLFSYKKNLPRFLKYKNVRGRLTDFKEVVEKTIAESHFETVVFFTDDSMFFREANIDKSILDEIAMDDTFKLVYSLRHGINIKPLPPGILPYGNDFIWNIEPSSKDLSHWTYRFSVDGHVYSGKFLLSVIKKLNYVNPNSFESFVNDYLFYKKPSTCSRLIFPGHSSLIGFELNRVQTFSDNDNKQFSIDFLNNRFMDGSHLNYLYENKSITDFHPVLKGIELYKDVFTKEVIHFDK